MGRGMIRRTDERNGKGIWEVGGGVKVRTDKGKEERGGRMRTK
jgi:hypothetical protein